MNTKRIASANQLTAAPRQWTKQGNNPPVCGNYTTAGNDVNSAETKALNLLRQWGYEAIQSPDWLARKDGKWLCVEVKAKSELYSPGKDCPFSGIGLDISQVWLRSQLFQDLKIRTYLIVFVKDIDKVYGAYLDELEKGQFYDTKNDIRIYPITSYTAITTLTTIDKGVVRNDN